ncbi:MAG: ornithine cyclodeaminase family protein [Nitriliruptorales bacterium]|nr:ornithine cyclodeaminase family protein [Nitriliruptorales bacterium]
MQDIPVVHLDRDVPFDAHAVVELATGGDDWFRHTQLRVFAPTGLAVLPSGGRDSIIYIVGGRACGRSADDGTPVLVITEADVEAVLPLTAALEAVELVFAADPESTDTLPRRRLFLGSTRLNVLGGAWAAPGRLAVKAYTRNDQSCVVLFDGSGDFLAVIEGKALSRARTAAATGVATRWLSRSDSRCAAILGTGWQATAQLQAVCAVRPIDDVQVWSPTAAHRSRFAEEMGALLGVDVTATATAVEAVEGADIVVTATKARDPVLAGAWLRPGTHVNLVGANQKANREADDAVVSSGAVVVVDDVAQAEAEAGEFHSAIRAGVLRWADVSELRDIVGGRAAGRTNAEQITVFKSLGIGLEDVAVASIVYDRVTAATGDA